MSLWPKTIWIYTDGACRGNPGPCSLGLQVLDKHKHIVYEESLYLEDHNTNNFAEYKAVIRALELCKKHHVEELFLFSDSQLLIRQLQGIYKVKSSNIRLLFASCQQILKHIPKYHFEHILRDKNQAADALANQALDNKQNF